MSLAIGIASLAIAALAAARRRCPALDARVESWGIALERARVVAVRRRVSYAASRHARSAARERQAAPWNALKKPKARRMRLSSVANSIRLTKAFSENEFEMGISALAARLGLAKSTVHRLATTLVEYDILEQNRETGKYRLGLALFELGTLVRRKMDATSEAQVQIHALAEATGETVQLAILDHLSVLYIRIRESRQAVRMSSGLGSRAPAHCTSVGKALLAFQPPEVVQQVIDNGPEALHRATPSPSPRRSLAELAPIRQKGYAIDDEEIEVGPALRRRADPRPHRAGDRRDQRGGARAAHEQEDRCRRRFRRWSPRPRRSRAAWATCRRSPARAMAE